MAPEIINCDQNSPEWYEARRGIPTASSFSSILAKGQGKMRDTYMRKLAGEIISKKPASNYTNRQMERGHEMEDEARNYYDLMTNNNPELVGFIRNGRKGCSPDSLIGNNGLLEIKTQEAHLLIQTILKDQVPPEHKAQLQGQLWVSEREWVDLIVYWPGMPPFIKRVTRDVAYIANLKLEVERFLEDLDAMVAKVSQYQPRLSAA